MHITNFPFTKRHFEILFLLNEKTFVRDNKLCQQLDTTRSSLFDYLKDLEILQLVHSHREQPSNEKKRGRPKTVWDLNRNIFNQYIGFFMRESQQLNNSQKQSRTIHLSDEKREKRVKRRLSDNESKVSKAMSLIFS